MKGIDVAFLVSSNQTEKYGGAPAADDDAYKVAWLLRQGGPIP